MATAQSKTDPAGRPAHPRQSKVVDPPGIQPVAPVRISDHVSEQIRRLILSENLDEGARLPSERYLAERFGASRPTVSQALRRLSLMGETVSTTSHWIAADTVFHAAVVGAAGNSYLTAVYEGVHTAVLSYEYDEWLETDAEPAWMRIARNKHRELHEPILDAVLKRRPAVARAAVLAHHEVMLEHIEDAAQHRGGKRGRTRR